MSDSNVVFLGPHDRMTPEEALESVKKESPSEVLVVYADENGVWVRSSEMTDHTAVWLLEVAKLQVIKEF